MPAFEMEILCCSMASWMLVLSWSFICKSQMLDSPQHIPVTLVSPQPRAKPTNPESHHLHEWTYLVKFINKTHSSISQNQGSSF